MSMIEFSVGAIAIKGVGFYGQSLATLFAAMIFMIAWKNRPRQ
ncbi:hypothetical protein [Rhizobium sp.]